jgi:nitric oxide reductase subunit B
VEHGYWFARSSEFLESPLIEKLRWMRVPGDTVFAVGALVLVAFVFIGRREKASTVEIPQGVRVPAGD